MAGSHPRNRIVVLLGPVLLAACAPTGDAHLGETRSDPSITNPAAEGGQNGGGAASVDARAATDGGCVPALLAPTTALGAENGTFRLTSVGSDLVAVGQGDTAMRVYRVSQNGGPVRSSDVPGATNPFVSYIAPGCGWLGVIGLLPGDGWSSDHVIMLLDDRDQIIWQTDLGTPSTFAGTFFGFIGHSDRFLIVRGTGVQTVDCTGKASPISDLSHLAGTDCAPADAMCLLTAPATDGSHIGVSLTKVTSGGFTFLQTRGWFLVLDLDGRVTAGPTLFAHGISPSVVGGSGSCGASCFIVTGTAGGQGVLQWFDARASVTRTVSASLEGYAVNGVFPSDDILYVGGANAGSPSPTQFSLHAFDRDGVPLDPNDLGQARAIAQPTPAPCAADDLAGVTPFSPSRAAALISNQDYTPCARTLSIRTFGCK